MRKKLLSRLLVFLLFLYHSSNQHSPLQLRQEIKFVWQSANTHALTYPISELVQVDTMFCFMKLSVIDYKNQDKNSNCTFENDWNKYQCVRLFDENGKKIESQQLDLDSQIQGYSVTNKKEQSSNRILQSSSFVVKLESQQYQQKIILNTTQLQQKFVRLYSCQSYSNDEQKCTGDWKLNYLQFYTPNFQGNILMQRYHACGRNNTIQVHVMYGGVIRDSQDLMMFGVVSIEKNKTKKGLNMWGGIAYSNDHASRDMFCYNNKGLGTDSISFLAGAVYQDTNQNVGTTDDVTISSNSYSADNNDPWAHFIQYYRKYNTGDFSGDQILKQTIYGRFSFAGYFSTNNYTSTETLSCLSSTYKHNFILLMKSHVDLHEIIGLVMFYIILLLFGVAL